jgi:amino acid permease
MGARLKHNNAVVATHTDSGHSESLLPVIINIVADLAPHGMLPLAFGISEGGLVGIVPAILTMMLFGGMSAYSMKTYAKLATEHQAGSLSEIWSKIVGKNTNWIVSSSLLALCFGCCVFYSAFVGDIFATLMSALPVGDFFKSRANLLVFITAGAITPLCLLEDLSALEPTAKLGVLGILYTVLFVVLRAFDGSYDPSTSEWLADMPGDKQPQWSESLGLWNFNIPGLLVLINLLCVSFLAHYNSISYYNEIKGGTTKKYSRAVNAGFGAASVIFATMMFAGYKLFGDAAQPLILNNFHPSADTLATGARIAVGLAIIVAYPLMFNALKTALFNLFPVAMNTSRDGGKTITAASKRNRQVAVLSILACITAIGVQCGEEDVSFVLGLVGSVLGTGFAYTLPGYLSLRNMKLRKAKKLKNAGYDVLMCHLIVAVGGVFGLLGFVATVREHLL